MKHETGQTSLIITMFLAIILGIIVLGFTHVSSSAGLNNISNEESIQANYAAQSGVNDAIQAIKDGVVIPPIGSQNCSTFITKMQQWSPPFQNVLSTNPSIGYNCLRVQATPSDLQFSVTQAVSSVAEIDPSAPTTKLTISWPASIPGYDVSDCIPANLQFVPPPKWQCPFPVIRMDLYNYNAADNSATASANNTEAAILLANDTDSFFLFPTDGPGGTTPGPVKFDNVVNGVVSNQPTIIYAGCNNSSCEATLTFAVPFSLGYIRLYSIYGDAGTPEAPVTIAGDADVTFANSQLEIDSTGVDQNVIQRISVRVPLTTNVGSAPDFAVDGGVAMCKHYTLGGPGSSPSIGLLEWFPLCSDVRKPAIYLYPTKTEVVNVKVSYPTGFEKTIPAYNPSTGWNVIAQPSGKLTDLDNDKVYPYLFWEGNLNSLNFDMSKGFVVSGVDTAAFLRHELPIIGLNKTETTAFLGYWLPQIENNKYNLIHFAGSEYTNIAPLDITPKPDSELRLMMAVYPINMPITVTPQTFPTFHRIGFTVVEWGGTILGQ